MEWEEQQEQGEDDEDQIAKIRALRVLSLQHVVEFYPICSLGICLSSFFFNICSYIYQILESKKGTGSSMDSVYVTKTWYHTLPVNVSG